MSTRSVLAVVVTCVGLVAGTAAAATLPPGGTFNDDDANVHEANIEAIAAEGITRGCNPPDNDMFCPTARVTRGQMAAFLVRALGLTDDGGGNTFIDDDGSVFETDIAKLAAAGITKGCNPPDNDMFCPTAAVTRGQMAAFLVRALELTDDGGGNTFIDDDGSVFETDIAKLAAAGITKGCNPPDNDMFCPAAAVTRGQMASFLARALDLDPIIPPSPAATYACLVTDVGGIDDASFNQSAWQGALDAAAQLDDVAIQYAESLSEAEYRPNIDAFIADGCDVIITVGFLLAADTEAAAQANPTQDFAIVDFPGTEPNIRGSQFNTAESAFLAGYLAAGMSATDAVGTFGGVQIPQVTVFMDGFAWGVEHYNTVKGASVEIYGWDPDTQTGLFTNSFQDLAKGAMFAEDLVDMGADIVLPVAGPTGIGAAEYCHDSAECLAIGVDSDWYVTVPEYADIFLTSVLKKIDAFVFDTIENEVLTGIVGDEYIGTLANGGTDLAPYHDLAGVVPQSLQDEIDELRNDIIDGIVVPGA